MPKIKELLGVDSGGARIMGVEMAPLAPVKELSRLVKAALDDHEERIEALEAMTAPAVPSEDLTGRLNDAYGLHLRNEANAILGRKKDPDA